eukprot:Gregarina_sp_Poly_1__7197@NODE_394_length_8954_cov_220_544278_g323_i0_p1_GENE_NODE_394_length_8954_cov_220_544278_g323_i0NODE_394_length_8954_cov_220_544278_g323_i0_p1_ORF_typecomplete_len754_score72_47XPG_N/PF00752_17/0_0067_NODE_394_length_8954_cov_220_544278_g323_i047937054
MGIRGLWRAVCRVSLQQRLKYHVLGRKSVLVDFHAWIFWIFHTLMPGRPRSAAQLLSTGYSDLTRMVDCWLSALQAQDLHPEFIASGKPGTWLLDYCTETYHTSTQEKRKHKHYEKMLLKTYMQRAVQQRNPCLLQDVISSEPLPKAHSLIRRHLRQTGYFVYRCEGESDKMLDILMEVFGGFGSSGNMQSDARQESSPEIAFAVTNDSNLLLMPHCKVLFFQESERSPLWKGITEMAWDLFCGHSTEPWRLDTPIAYLWTAAHLLRALRLRPSDGPLLALAVGTFCTKPLYECSVSEFLQKLDRDALETGEMEISVEGETFLLNDVTLPGLRLSADHTLLCRYFRLIETKGDLTQKGEWLRNYNRARSVIFAARGIDPGRDADFFTSMSRVQELAILADSDKSLLKYLHYLDLPSFLMIPSSPERCWFCDPNYDDYESLPAHLRYPLQEQGLDLRTRIYFVLLSSERVAGENPCITEYWQTLSNASVKRVIEPKWKKSFPGFRELPFLADAARATLFTSFLFGGKFQDRFDDTGIISCSLAKFSTFEVLEFDAALLSTIIRSNHTRAIWKSEISNTSIDRYTNQVEPPDRPLAPPRHDEYTLSEPAIWTLWKDYKKLKLPLGLLRKLPATSLSHWEWIQYLLDSIISPEVPKVYRCLPSSRVYTLWYRLMDYYDHLFWAQSLFLLCQNSPMFFEYFFDIQLYYLLCFALETNSADFYVAEDVVNNVIPTLKDMAITIKETEWVLSHTSHTTT